MMLLTVKQVCDKLQVKKSYLYLMTHQNRIPHIKIGNHLRFDEDDIEKWLKENKNGNGNGGDH